MRASFCSFCSLLLGILSSGYAEEKRVNFAREVLPILSDKCFVCHGPDTRKKSGLRLDSYEAATRDRKGVRAIHPEAPEKSEILVRLHDREDPMPPVDAEKKLRDTERTLLDRWVRQGGRYTRHWAFVPPVKERGLPATGAIDHYVAQALKASGGHFAPLADRATLARRAALVLSGLPPEPGQLAAFLADSRPDAYARLVDELMASPRFGEHQARYWLDAIRYGDTHGLHLDNKRAIFPYRDWVIQAMNANKPLDVFITEQLAGDLLADPTLEQRVATGFVRMNPTTAEGGAIVAEFQAKNSFDRTETLGTVLMGMTLLCARCHTHKYDPIQQIDYYRLLAFFNNTAEPALDGNKYTWGPTVEVPPDIPSWQAWKRIAQERDRVLDGLEIDQPRVIRHAEAAAKLKIEKWQISKPVPIDKALAEIKAWGPGKGLPGIRRDKLPKPGEARWISFKLTATTNQLVWLTFSGERDSEVLLNGEALPGDAPRVDARRSTIGLSLTNGNHTVHIKMAGSAREQAVEARIYNPWKSLAQHKQWAKADPDDRLLILVDEQGPLAKATTKAAKALAAELVDIRMRFTQTVVAEELAKPRETRLLDRGEYDQPRGDPLEPDVPSVMGAFPADAPRNRLGLAQWLTAREHPLVARVLVNRIWQRSFGHGLVRTPEDFGLQGQQSTHPELLDWLAVELHDSGWDLKHLLRLMVTSRTFRQSSAWRADLKDPENRLFARGPGYRLDAEVLRDIALWSSRLLDPHMGGEGVKPYQPTGMWEALMHPGSNTREYVRDHGRPLYRRSLYVYWKRTSPHPMMTLFNAPNRESSCVRRSRTSTPMQSLGLLNEIQRVEMGRGLAERLIRQNPGDAARLNQIFTLLACRNPTDTERKACTRLLDKLRERYAAAPEDARALLDIGDAPRDETLDLAEYATWTQLAITVLASDIAILLY
jgi:hypothetical protein